MSSSTLLTKTIRVLIADDHPAVCQGLGLLLEPEGITVCAEATCEADALARIKQCRPDLALVDLSLGDDDGVVLVRELQERGIPSLVYSMHEDGGHVHSAFTAGAHGYVTKREIHRVLIEAIRVVADGSRFVSPRAALALANRAADPEGQDPLCGLSTQERHVYLLVGEGAGTTEIALAMQISARTVESYYARILVKLGLEGMRELRRHAISHLHDRS